MKNEIFDKICPNCNEFTEIDLHKADIQLDKDGDVVATLACDMCAVRINHIYEHIRSEC